MHTTAGERAMKKAVLAGAIVGALICGGTAVASDPISLPTGSEGCVSAPGDTCTYITTRSGGYATGGSTWKLTIQIAANGDPRDTNLDGKLRYVFTSANGPKQGCGLWEPGSTVTTNAGSEPLAAGNPFPGASDAVIGSNNDCPTGRVTASNPSYTPVD
jgi:hypothetical protein